MTWDWDWLFGRKYLKEQIKNLQSNYDRLFIKNEVNQLMAGFFRDSRSNGFEDKNMQFMTTVANLYGLENEIYELLKAEPEIREAEVVQPNYTFNTILKGVFNCMAGGIK